MTKHSESCLQEIRERPRSPLVRSSVVILSLHGPPGEKKFKMSLKRLCPHLPKLSWLVVGPLVERTCQHCLFFFFLIEFQDIF